MPVDTSILSRLQPFQPAQQDSLGTYAKILGIQGAMGQQDLQNLQIKKATGDMADEEAIKQAYQQSGGDSATLRKLLTAGGNHKALQALDKFQLEKDEKQSAISKNNAQAGKANWEVELGHLQHGAALLDMAKDPESFASVLRIGQLNGTFKPEFVAQMTQQGYSPELVKSLQNAGMTRAQQLEAQHKVQELALKGANEPFAPGPAGPVANQPVQDFQLKKAKAGSSQISVNTEKNFLQSIGDVLGKDVANTAGNARAAVGTINTVNQIRDALDTGKVIAGPGTTARQFLGQVGQAIGVSGADATEQLTNTRKAIQGLAQLELDAAQQMKGQGAITEAERGIIRRAAAGDIDNLSVPEMRTLTDVLDRSARTKIKANASNITRLKGNPNAASMVDFMDVQEPAAYQPRSAQAVPNPAPGQPAPMTGAPGARPGGIKFLGFE